jgi:hypothetical protein
MIAETDDEEDWPANHLHWAGSLSCILEDRGWCML